MIRCANVPGSVKRKKLPEDMHHFYGEVAVQKSLSSKVLIIGKNPILLYFYLVFKHPRKLFYCLRMTIGCDTYYIKVIHHVNINSLVFI